MFRACVFALLVAGVGLAADEKTEQKAVAGVWEVETAELGGDDALPIMKGFVLTLKDDTWKLEKAGKADTGTMKLDGSKAPKWMDLVGDENSPHKGKTIPCIYKMDGGKMVVCYDLEYKTRPAAFKTEKGTKQFLATYTPKAKG